MSSSTFIKQEGTVARILVKSEQTPRESSPMTSKKFLYKLYLKPEEVSNDEKINLLNSLLEEECEVPERIEYLSTRANIYYAKNQWDGALKDIVEIEALDGGTLNGALSTLKGQANVQRSLDLVREAILSAIASRTDHKIEFVQLIDYLSVDNIADILHGKSKRDHGKSTKRRL